MINNTGYKLGETHFFGVEDPDKGWFQPIDKSVSAIIELMSPAIALSAYGDKEVAMINACYWEDDIQIEFKEFVDQSDFLLWLNELSIIVDKEGVKESV